MDIPDTLKLGTLTLPISIFDLLSDDPQVWHHVKERSLQQAISSGDWNGLVPGTTQRCINLAKDLLKLSREKQAGLRLWAGNRGEVVVFRVELKVGKEGLFLGKRFKAVLKRLFKCLRRGWDGDGDLLLNACQEDIDLDMATLYATIPSPVHPSLDNVDLQAVDKQNLSSYAYGGGTNPAGVKTQMFKYQVESTARMYMMEIQPDNIADPYYTAMIDSDDQQYQYNAELAAITFDAPPLPLPRGGLLTQPMGCGKSLICLALIVSTLHQQTREPYGSDIPSRRMISHITTLERMYTNPSPDDKNLVHIDRNLRYEMGEIERERKAGKDSYQGVNGALHLPFYYDTTITGSGRTTRGNEALEGKRMYMSNATLLVVPSILIPQWLEEIDKHLDQGILKVKNVKYKEDMVAFEKLSLCEVIKPDIILLAAECLMKRDGDVTRRKDRGLKRNSVLTTIRWKRLLLDEGAVAADQSVSLISFISELSVERSWLISGTPTKHLKQGDEAVTELEIEPPLFGVQLSSAGEDVNGEETVIGEDEAEAGIIKKEGKGVIKKDNGGNSSGSESGDNDLGIKLEEEDDGEVRTRWSQRDQIDLHCFGHMLAGILGVPVFRSYATSKVYTKTVVAPLREKGGPRPGAVARIRELMNKLMVKHQIQDIENECPLPAITIKHEVIKLDPLQRLHYNGLLAAAVISAEVGAKGDMPAFFRDLSRCLAWLPAKPQGYKEDLETVQKRLIHLRDDDQRRKLLIVQQHLQKLLKDEVWMDVNTTGHQTVPCAIQSYLNPDILAVWSESPENAPNLVGALTLQHLRDANKKGASVIDVNLAYGPFHNLYHKGATIDSVIAKPGKSPSPSNITPDARPIPDQLTITTRSAKINHVVKLILEADQSDTFVVFVHGLDIEVLGNTLMAASIEFTYLGPGMSKALQHEALMEIREDGHRVCILDWQIAINGLNLIFANRMIFVAPIWNLAKRAQAIKRVHRIGQTRPVSVHVFVGHGTHEQDIFNQQRKSSVPVDKMAYFRSICANPKYVQVEADATFTFRANMIPYEPVDTASTSDDGISWLTRSSPLSIFSDLEPVAPESGKKRKGVADDRALVSRRRM